MAIDEKLLERREKARRELVKVLGKVVNYLIEKGYPKILGKEGENLGINFDILRNSVEAKDFEEILRAELHSASQNDINGRTEIERKELWSKFDRTARKWEGAFEAGAAIALEHDRREMGAMVGEAKKSALRRKKSINWKKVLKQIEEYLEEAGEEFWRETFAPLIQGVVSSQGKRWATELGVEFDVQNLRAREWFNDYTLHFAQPVNDTTEREIATIMNRAQAEGSSGAQVERQLEATFDQWISGHKPEDPEWEWFTDRTPPFRREMIARTETVRASNAGTDGLFKDWGVQKKEWLSTKDDRTREDHAEADGQVVGIEEKFVVGGEELEYPGDPAGSEGNVINCRCTEIPVVEEPSPQPSPVD